ncbi:hypothetical protein [Chthoniobacter flavus]|uniref:hypothetical protein n=1 Tax=Chthoniobacter flavus TaxID=191863 RepID=UPI0005B2882D|nr:hypothetical protein [Chthoniobacter flavus]
MLSSAEPPPGASPANAEILVDGKPLGATAEGFRIPASHKSVSFRLGRSPEDETEGSRRVQFKLEGVDNGWRQLRSEMSLMVRFGDAAGDQVAQRIFVVEGISQGWRGSVESSAFTERRETVRVPPDSTFLTVAISSSGPPTAMGIYLVRGVKIFRNSPSGPELLFAAATDREGTDTNGWRRSGTRPSMAKMVHTSAGEAFCILDDDPNAHAEWNLPRAAAPKVQPGESLTVEWSEMYDIGTGSRFEVNYGRLNAGHYRFLTDVLDNHRQPAGRRAAARLRGPGALVEASSFLDQRVRRHRDSSLAGRPGDHPETHPATSRECRAGTLDRAGTPAHRARSAR